MIEFRELQLLDIETAVEWMRKDPDILRQFELEDASDFKIRSALMTVMNDPTQVWLVAKRGDDDVGIVAATAIDPVRRTASPHIVISPDHRFGRTYKTVQKAAIEYARDVLGLKHLIAAVPNDNKVAIKANLQEGFVKKDVTMMTLDLNGGGGNGRRSDQ